VIETIMTYIATFIAIFTSLSIVRLAVNFIKALLSTPPKKFEIGVGSLIYYGLCLSYLITLIITAI
jgi:hypothetical protein